MTFGTSWAPLETPAIDKPKDVGHPLFPLW